MPRTIRFHLDEHVHPAVAHGLRRRGMEVTTTEEVGLGGASETAHVQYALAQGRVIYTNDEDYLRLHDQGIEHAGIAYCDQQSRSIG